MDQGLASGMILGNTWVTQVRALAVIACTRVNTIYTYYSSVYMDIRVSGVCKTMHGALTGGQGVAGSNPVIPTNKNRAQSTLSVEPFPFGVTLGSLRSSIRQALFRLPQPNPDTLLRPARHAPVPRRRRHRGAVNLTKWTHFSPGATAHRPVTQEAHVTTSHLYRLRVLGQWFDGIRFYAAASNPRRSRRTWAGLR